MLAYVILVSIGQDTINVLVISDHFLLYAICSVIISAAPETLPVNKTAVFNLTTNDGGTIFYIDGKEEFVESIENSVVIFDGPTDHAGVTQKNSNIRTLLNMDFNDGEYLGRY